MDENTTVESGADDPTIERVADIVSAYLSHNRVPVGELPTLIEATHAALAGLSKPTAVAEEVEKPTPAQIRKSVTPDAIVSFIDGKPYKTLKRHLTGNGLTIETYRARFGLPADYPSTAANYSAARSALARQLGLGNARKAAPKATAPAGTVSSSPETPEPAGKPTRGRKKAATAE